MYPLRWDQDPAPRLRYCFLAAPSLSLHPLPSLINNCLNLPFGTQGRSRRLESVPYKQGTGDTERLLCPAAPRGPARFHYQIWGAVEGFEQGSDMIHLSFNKLPPATT